MNEHDGVLMLYVYCITGMTPGIEYKLKAGAECFFVRHKDLCALASRVSSSEFGEENLKKNLNDTGWLESRVLTHERVVEEVMNECTVIPLKFGTVFTAEENVRHMLEERRANFRTVLGRLEGKEEWGVKVYCDMDGLKKRLSEEEEDIRRFEDDIRSSSPGKAYLLKKKAAGLLDEILAKRTWEYNNDSVEGLTERSHGVVVNGTIPEEVTGVKEKMILNTACLVEKTRLGEFLGAVNSLGEKYEDACLKFVCTGPWPPYNFCS